MNKENVITLDNPVKRGEQVIEQVTLMKPNAGTLRGVSVWLRLQTPKSMH